MYTLDQNVSELHVYKNKVFYMHAHQDWAIY